MSHNPDITPDIDHLLPYLSFLPFFMKGGHVIALSLGHVQTYRIKPGQIMIYQKTISCKS